MTTSAHSGQFIEVNGVNIYYEEYGQGAPLLLIHGGTITSASWQPYLAAFAEHYRVITPDSRGHGRTVNPISTMSYQLLADDMVALAHALDLQKPLIYGYSDGGQVALEIGMRYPELPQALVIGGAWFKFTEEYQALIRSFFGDADVVDTDQFAQKNPGWATWLQQIYGPDDLKRLLQQIKPMWETPLNYTADDFARVVAPSLILLGDRDSFIPVEEASEMFRLLPNAELAVLPGIDHGGFLSEKVALIQPLILDFLQRHGHTVAQAATDAHLSA